MTAASLPIIFVTGASRSGTTLVCQVLGRHSEIAGLREMQYFGGSWSRLGRRRGMDRSEAHRAVSALVRRQDRGATESRAMNAVVDRIMSSLAANTDNVEVFATTVSHLAERLGKSIACEQTPRNIYYAEELLDHLPNARFVHVLRDPRAVTASQKNRWRKRALMSNPQRMSRRQQCRAWVNYHPYTVARLWNRATAEAMRLQSHPRFRTLLFEQLIADPERTVRDLCGFLELDYESAMLAVEHVNSSYVASTGREAGFSGTPIDSWRSALTSAEIAIITKRCGELMMRAGYEPGPAIATPRASAALTLRYALHVAGAIAFNPQQVLIQAQAALRHNHEAAARRTWNTNDQPAVIDSHDASLSGSTSKPVFGLACMDASLEAAADHLVSCARTRTSCQVAFVNAHCLNESVEDPALLKALQHADILFADGIGMQLASRLHGHRLENNVNGTDLFPYICDRAETAGVAIGLLGGAPGVADRCTEVLLQRNPKLHVNFAQNGFIEPGTDDAVITAINASGIDMLLVAMGVPRQERWILDYGDRLKVPVLISVGGLLDFVSGRVPRAPAVLRKLRLEWLFRLYVEPRRLFRRYVLGNPVFLARALKFASTGRLWNVDKPIVNEGAQ